MRGNTTALEKHARGPPATRMLAARGTGDYQAQLCGRGSLSLRLGVARRRRRRAAPGRKWPGRAQASAGAGLRFPARAADRDFAAARDCSLGRWPGPGPAGQTRRRRSESGGLRPRGQLHWQGFLCTPCTPCTPLPCLLCCRHLPWLRDARSRLRRLPAIGTDRYGCV